MEEIERPKMECLLYDDCKNCPYENTTCLPSAWWKTGRDKPCGGCVGKLDRDKRFDPPKDKYGGGMLAYRCRVCGRLTCVESKKHLCRMNMPCDVCKFNGTTCIMIRDQT
jgi:hypothetical protein